MPITMLTSPAFDQDTGSAKKAAENGPVFITDHGQPAHVLLTIEDYRKLKGSEPTIADLLASPETADIDFDPPRLRGPFALAADLS
jgi:prevent-host-death family protein